MAPSNPPASPTTRDGACQATNAAGEPCGATPQAGREWCWHHDPDLADERAEARARGGRHRSGAARARKRLPGEVSRMLDMIVEAFEDAHRGEYPQARAQTLASLANAYSRLHEIGEHDVALDDLAERVEAVEGHPGWGVVK